MLKRITHVLVLCMLTITMIACGKPASAVNSASHTDFGRFTGTWTAHYGMLKVEHDGKAHYMARTYTWCGSKVTGPCDSFEGNTIKPGIDIEIQFTRADTNSAYGLVTTARGSKVGTAVSLTIGANNTVLFQEGTSPTRSLCSEQAPVGTCGA